MPWEITDDVEVCAGRAWQLLTAHSIENTIAAPFGLTKRHCPAARDSIGLDHFRPDSPVRFPWPAAPVASETASFGKGVFRWWDVIVALSLISAAGRA